MKSTYYLVIFVGRSLCVPGDLPLKEIFSNNKWVKMEAVPRMPMLSLELKQSPEYVEFGPVLKQVC